MKVTYNSQIGRYVVSDKGVILHTCQDLGDAQRLAGAKPESQEVTGTDEG